MIELMYIWLTGIIIFLLGAVALLVFTDVLRLLKVGYLVLVATPYQQSVTEAEGNILVVGDSTAYGTGAKDTTKTIAGRIGADFPEYSLENRGVNGWTTGDLALALESGDQTERFSLIVIQIGGNDTLQKRSAADVERDIRRVYEATTKRSDRVVMISSGNVGAASAFVVAGQADKSFENQTRVVREIFTRVAPEYGVTFVDLFVEPSDDVYLQDPKKYLAFDGLHPNETGYGYWYESLGPVVRTLLAK